MAGQDDRNRVVRARGSHGRTAPDCHLARELLVARAPPVPDVGEELHHLASEPGQAQVHRDGEFFPLPREVFGELGARALEDLRGRALGRRGRFFGSVQHPGAGVLHEAREGLAFVFETHPHDPPRGGGEEESAERGFEVSVRRVEDSTDSAWRMRPVPAQPAEQEHPRAQLVAKEVAVLLENRSEVGDAVGPNSARGRTLPPRSAAISSYGSPPR